MRKLTTPTDLAWALAQPSGFLINIGSKDGVHEVHKLPLKKGCQGERMSVPPPKFYTTNTGDLTAHLGQQGSAWVFCPYC